MVRSRSTSDPTSTRSCLHQGCSDSRKEGVWFLTEIAAICLQVLYSQVSLQSWIYSIYKVYFCGVFCLQHVHVTLRVHRVRSAISWPVSVFVFRERTVDSVIAVCRATGASPLAFPVPAMDTPTTATLTLDTALTAGTTAPDKAVTGEIYLWYNTNCDTRARYQQLEVQLSQINI